VLVFETRLEAQSSYLFNPQRDEQIPLKKAVYMTVSPDGQHLAYLDAHSEAQNWRLVVRGADDQPERTIPWDASWNNIADWLDNERLAISRDIHGGSHLYELASLVILNPFIGEQHELLPDYPGIFTELQPLGWNSYNDSRTVYDPTLTRVVYPSIKRVSGDMVALIMADVQTRQPSAHFLTLPILFGSLPRWSPDGTRFVTDAYPDLNGSSSIKYVGGSELYTMARDGKTQRLTYLTVAYTALPTNYGWSPDGRYIAFWLKAKESLYPGQRLAVLDTTTSEVTNYCILGDPHNLAAPAPVWSPDGQHLLVETIDPADINHRIVVLVALKPGWAAQIAENVTPAGWMVAP
jgi:hypothetical protein